MQLVFKPEGKNHFGASNFMFDWDISFVLLSGVSGPGVSEPGAEVCAGARSCSEAALQKVQKSSARAWHRFAFGFGEFGPLGCGTEADAA